MKEFHGLRGLLAVVLAGAGLLLAGCASTPKSYDFSAYRQNPPKSILVLPPLNQSVDVNAPYVYLSSVSVPLAEHGYYVFPVALVETFMRENGTSDPAEMQAVPLSKLNAIFAPDAVLYTTINDWGQKYHVVSSDTTVELTSKLVDAQSGALLWQGHRRFVQSSNNGQGGLLAQVIVAAVQQVAGSTQDYSRKASTLTNTALIYDPDTGLPYGPYNPKAATDPRRVSAAN